MPPQARISNVKFSPDGSHLAFLQTKDTGIELWIADGATGSAKAVVSGADRINATTGDPCDWLQRQRDYGLRAGAGQPRPRAGGADRAGGSERPGELRQGRAGADLRRSA